MTCAAYPALLQPYYGDSTRLLKLKHLLIARFAQMFGGYKECISCSMYLQAHEAIDYSDELHKLLADSDPFDEPGVALGVTPAQLRRFKQNIYEFSSMRKFLL